MLIKVYRERVTICFIDSGFYAHPDLTAYRNRIKKIIDVTKPEVSPTGSEIFDGAWHGTMTTVVCAGDGYLSKGLYRDGHGCLRECNRTGTEVWYIVLHPLDAP